MILWAATSPFPKQDLKNRVQAEAEVMAVVEDAEAEDLAVVVDVAVVAVEIAAADAGVAAAAVVVAEAAETGSFRAM